MPPLPRFDGRLPRGRFWLGSLLAWAGFALLFAALEASAGRAATLVLYPPFFWLLGLLLVRRLHDRGRSARALLVLLVPLLGPLWVVVETALRRGQAGDNRYGRDPLAPPDHLTVA